MNRKDVAFFITQEEESGCGNAKREGGRAIEDVGEGGRGQREKGEAEEGECALRLCGKEGKEEDVGGNVRTVRADDQENLKREAGGPEGNQKLMVFLSGPWPIFPLRNLGISWVRPPEN